MILFQLVYVCLYALFDHSPFSARLKREFFIPLPLSLVAAPAVKTDLLFAVIFQKHYR
jgi:hypothetical protein